MPKRNPFSRFHDLTSTGGLYLATVIDHRPGGQSLVESLDGTRTLVNGQSVAESARAIIKDGAILGAAGSLAPIDIELF